MCVCVYVYVYVPVYVYVNGCTSMRALNTPSVKYLWDSSTKTEFL